MSAKLAVLITASAAFLVGCGQSETGISAKIDQVINNQAIISARLDVISSNVAAIPNIRTMDTIHQFYYTNLISVIDAAHGNALDHQTNDAKWIVDTVKWYGSRLQTGQVTVLEGVQLVFTNACDRDRDIRQQLFEIKMKSDDIKFDTGWLMKKP